MLWGVFALKCFVFQKFYFSRFSIDRKCDKNFSYNMLGLIGAWLVLDRSKLIFDRLNLFFDRSKISQWVFTKIFLSRVLHTFQIFSKAFSLSLLDQSNLSFFFFCCFLPKSFKRFLSSSLSKSLLPFFIFIQIIIFMHCSCFFVEIFELNMF